uniref:Signal peptidase I n=1 Tax=Gracilinema caldarium TaxID=215591 RepID=A0A7C3EEE3_9SPIR
MAQGSNFFNNVQRFTEKVLTTRRAKLRVKKEKQKAKNPILDWIEAFVWAAGMVLIINQYLFQAYQIPSGSMIDTLLIGDRIFVNKLIYGPELLPGVGKLPSPFKPQRNQVIIFENPSYISRGPAFDVLQRVLYMLTLSLVDIDRDENGSPKAHFLIKRAVGMSGDTLTMKNGEMYFLFPGEDRVVAERDYIKANKMDHVINRLMDVSAYPALQAAGRMAAYSDLGLPVPSYLQDLVKNASNLNYPDYLEHERSRILVLQAANPQDRRYTMLSARFRLGWYVPEGRIFPMGDNRDNSRDARYFGAVRLSKVLGQGALKYWPLSRFGVIK